MEDCTAERVQDFLDLCLRDDSDFFVSDADRNILELAGESKVRKFWLGLVLGAITNFQIEENVNI